VLALPGLGTSRDRDRSYAPADRRQIPEAPQNLIDALTAALTGWRLVSWVQLAAHSDAWRTRCARPIRKALDAGLPPRPQTACRAIAALPPKLSPLRPHEVAVLTVTPVFSAAAGSGCGHVRGSSLRCYGAGTVPDSPPFAALPCARAETGRSGGFAAARWCRRRHADRTYAAGKAAAKTSAAGDRTVARLDTMKWPL